ncbi:MAG TPA: malate synthase G, partial [Gammaproteobacteria bacterium]|nr:malate synthase G [Gammaproteobacteria bacterium]
MADKEKIGNLQVATELVSFVNDELLPKLKLDQNSFWSGFESIITDFTPRNTELLKIRDDLQAQIDEWHLSNRDSLFDRDAYKNFLIDIGYLLQEGEPFNVETADVDSEISTQAGPQLAVPVKNARFALNAANARWGSLYDALYGTDVIAETDGAGRVGGYNPVRGDRVIEFAKQFLDSSCPLQNGRHSEASGYRIEDGELKVQCGDAVSGLRNDVQFRGCQGSPHSPTAVLLKNHDLHIEIQIDRESDIGRGDSAGVKDIMLEAAITTIQDCEDSVAAVDAEDKVEVYRNWLGLNTGDLQETFVKGGGEMTRVLNEDREFTAPDGSKFQLHGRSLLLVRNVGHLMRNCAII